MPRFQRVDGVGRARQCGQRDRHLGRAFHVHGAIRQHEVLGRRLQLLRREVQRPCADGLGRAERRASPHHRRAAGEGADAPGEAVAPPAFHHHLFGRDGQRLRHHLRERRVMALPLRGIAGRHVHVAGGLHAHLDPLVRRDAGPLDIEGDACAAEDALLALRRLASLHARVTERIERLRELGGIVAVAVDERRVALEDAARIPRAVLGPHQVAPPDRGRIQAERAGNVVHGRFHDEVAVRLACAAVGAHDRRVGVDGLVFRVHRRDLVGARQDGLGTLGIDGAVGAIGAAVVEEVIPDPEDAPVLRRRDLDAVHHQPLVIGADEVLAAVLDPLDWAAQHACRERDEQFLGVDQEDLDAEAAAHVRRDHGDCSLRQPELVRDHGAGGDRCLRRIPDRKLLEALVVAGDDAAGLHRLSCAALGPEFLAQHEVGGGEGGLDVSALVGGAASDVGIGVVVDQRRARLRRRNEIDRRHIGHIVDLDQFQRVLGEIAAVGDHQRHRLAGEARLAGCQRLMGARMDEAGVLVEQRHGRVGRAQVLVGDQRMHAGERERGGGIDERKSGLGVGAAQHGGVQHVGQADVVDEARAPGEQARILASLDRLPDQPRGHVSSPCITAAARRTAATIC